MEKNRKFRDLGVMIDCSRNGIMHLPALKKFIDRIAMMGYNQLYLHMENTYEVEGEPYFGYLRGRYTIAELNEAEEYAYEHGVEIIPLTQTLAHMTSLLQWPQYRAFSEDADTMLVGDERTYALIDRMYASLRKALPRAKYIHAAMDEAYGLGKGKYRDLHGEVPPIDIMVEHINRVCEIAKKYNFKPMIWYTTIYAAMQDTKRHFFWPGYPEGEKFDETLAARLPKDILVCHYNYNEHNHDTTQMKLSKRLEWTARLVGKENVMQGIGAWKWSSFCPRNRLSITNAYYAVRAGIENDVPMFFTTMWGDDGNEASAYSVLPSLAFTACAAHGIDDWDEVCKQFKEWFGVDMNDYLLLDLPDHAPDYMLGVPINQSKFQLYNDCFLGKLDKMVAGHDRANYEKLAVQIGEAAERGGEFKYVFDTIAALCSVLSIKADIGIRSREVYRSGDKAALDKLIADYKEMIKRTERFYACHRVQWDMENKPHGYEVQDARMGGLIARMTHCCDRLEAYRDGKLDRIMELEDDILEFVQTDKLPYDKKLPTTVRKTAVEPWKNIVTTNNL